MNKAPFVLAAISLLAATSRADEGSMARYRDPSGRISLTVHHEIEIRAAQPIEASRDLSLDLTLAADRETAAVTVTVDGAQAVSLAHGMRQRLGTRHLHGQSFPLSIADNGRRLASTAPDEAPAVDLGPMVPGGYPIAEVLVDALPVLPESDVAVGATWTTERSVRCLEGWAWGIGRLTSRHRVIAVERRDGHAVVSVTTDAEAHLGPVDDGRSYTGDLERTLHWTFDATEGRLLSLSMDQQTEGVSALGQTDTPIRQRTRLELATRSPVEAAAR